MHIFFQFFYNDTHVSFTLGYFMLELKIINEKWVLITQEYRLYCNNSCEMWVVILSELLLVIVNL